ncbi:hypothetical protein [Nostoc sp.]
MVRAFGKTFWFTEHDADINAAKNIAALGLSVIQPESPGLTCQLQGQMSLFGMFDLG